jgi:hypothetical protein
MPTPSSPPEIIFNTEPTNVKNISTVTRGQIFSQGAASLETRNILLSNEEGLFSRNFWSQLFPFRLDKRLL